MTQEIVDQIENQKFLTAQREAKEKSEREAKLALAEPVPAPEPEKVEDPAGDPIQAGALDSGPAAPTE